MRTLLIDNYDSYTFNLLQLLAEVNGVDPVVVDNDKVTAAHLAAADNVVISPGPGTPTRPRDFAGSAAVIATTDLPLLGICLGHQGIAASAGAPVVAAPVARHGHLSRIRHHGGDVFRGIPSGFTAVRYHSLCIPEPLPDALVATAWAEDGVVMGLRHRYRPQWGVQFHPESVATEYGRDLIANFHGLTARHQQARSRHPRRPDQTRRRAPSRPPAPTSEPTTSPGPVGSGPADPAGAERYRLLVRQVHHQVSTEAAFTSLFAASAWSFWLDSARVGAGPARFSMLGDGSGPLAELVRYRVGTGAVEVHSRDRPPLREPGTIFDYLRRELARRRLSAPGLPFDLAGGYVGYFGYELKADCGSPSRHRAPTPDACWLFADRLLVVDHEQDQTWLVAVYDPNAVASTSTSTSTDNGGGAAAEAWLDRAEVAVRALPAGAPPSEPQTALQTGLPSGLATGPEPGPPPRAQTEPYPAAGDRRLVEPWLVRDRAQYLADIEVCGRALAAGESYEICLTNAARITAAGSGLDFYRRLRRWNPAPYGAYLRFGEIEVACSSPERFLRIDRSRSAESRPIKGTVRRGRTTAEDHALRSALAASPKNRAENLMIVDLLRNDLGRVCAVGSVRVPQLMATETYATVHQLVSTIRGRLRDGVDAVDCAQACFPGGSMTGAPKLRTCEIIDGLEGEARGIYSGALGYFSCTGTADLAIVIRTAVLVGGQWRVGAGGAVVLDSDPADEYEEMLLKAAAVLTVSPPSGPPPASCSSRPARPPCRTRPASDS